MSESLTPAGDQAVTDLIDQGLWETERLLTMILPQLKGTDELFGVRGIVARLTEINGALCGLTPNGCNPGMVVDRDMAAARSIIMFGESEPESEAAEEEGHA